MYQPLPPHEITFPFARGLSRLAIILVLRGLRDALTQDEPTVFQGYRP
jgi:hypothetical protein